MITIELLILRLCMGLLDCRPSVKIQATSHLLAKISTIFQLSVNYDGSRLTLQSTQGAFFWDYSGIGILGIDGISVLLGAIPFSK